MYLSTDTQTLHNYFQPSDDNSIDPPTTNAENHSSTESNATIVNLPKPVSTYIHTQTKVLYNVVFNMCSDASELVDLDTELKH